MGREGLYEVSSLGRVRSLTLKVRDKNGRLQTRPGMIRKLQVGSGDHRTVDLKTRGVRKTVQVHRLMAEAFLPNPGRLPIVRHLNDIPYDNRIENLSWGTYSDNGHDMVRNGLHYFAKRDRCSRGHLYTEESSYRNRKQRVCRTCRREDYGAKEPPNHGTYSGYVTFGCRCAECKEAGRIYRMKRGKNGITKIESSK